MGSAVASCLCLSHLRFLWTVAAMLAVTNNNTARVFFFFYSGGWGGGGAASCLRLSSPPSPITICLVTPHMSTLRDQEVSLPGAANGDICTKTFHHCLLTPEWALVPNIYFSVLSVLYNLKKHFVRSLLTLSESVLCVCAAE